MQIDEPGANAGTKHRIDLPPAYRQFNDDGGEEKPSERNDLNVKNQTLQNEARHRNVTSKIKSRIKKPATKVKKPKNKSRKVRTLLNNYFMSRRRFYKLMESEMDR